MRIIFREYTYSDKWHGESICLFILEQFKDEKKNCQLSEFLLGKEFRINV